MPKYDVAIVAGGIVGLATSMVVSERFIAKKGLHVLIVCSRAHDAANVVLRLRGTGKHMCGDATWRAPR